MINKLREFWMAFRLALYLVRHPDTLYEDKGALSINVLCAWVMILLKVKGFDPGLKDKYKLAALLTSEIGEYVDSIKKGKPQTETENEVADIFIRACSLVLAEDMDITEALRRKMQFNFSRPRLYGTSEEVKGK